MDSRTANDNNRRKPNGQRRNGNRREEITLGKRHFMRMLCMALEAKDLDTKVIRVR